MRTHQIVLSSLIAAASCTALAGPPGDYGDAPVGNNGDGIDAYPGVTARWDTAFNHRTTVFSPQRPQGSWLNTSATCRAGVIAPTTRIDSTMDPALAENDCAPLILVYAPGPNPLAEIEVGVSTSNAHNPANPVYLNIWIDQNRDGQWKDGYFVSTPLIAWNLEWCVQDVPVVMPAGTTARINTGVIRLENPTSSVWVRVMVTEEPVGAAHRGPAGSASWFWDSTMNAAHNFHGEIEDHLLNFQTGAPPFLPAPGIWYRTEYNNPPIPIPPPKPACDVFYEGPWKVFPPLCPAGTLLSPLAYRSTERAGGCTAAPALWGMYGLRRIAGDPQPNVDIVAPFPVGSVMGAVNVVCPPPTGAAGLAPVVADEGPLMDSMTVPVASMTAGQIVMESCYPPPRRYRVWRAFFHTITCGSVHLSRTVFAPPQSGVTLASAVVSGAAGQSADYCDFIIGGLEEEFVDDASLPPRPFPDPDFTNYVFQLNSPSGSTAQLDFDTFTSPPASLLLRNAGYLVSPTFPDGSEAASIELRHRGFATLVATATDGTSITTTLPPTTDWALFSLPLPDGFRLQSLYINAPLTAHFDELYIALRDPGSEPFFCAADLGMQGGIPGHDGLLDNNDFVVFIDDFFNNDPHADLGVQGGLPGHDGMFDNNDFVVFIDLFFAGCGGG